MAATADETKVVSGVKTQLFIGGRWRDAEGGATLDVEDPATGETIGEVAKGSAEDVDRAVAAAERAFPSWAEVSPGQRALALLRLADLVEEHLDLGRIVDLIGAGPGDLPVLRGGLVR